MSSGTAPIFLPQNTAVSPGTHDEPRDSTFFIPHTHYMLRSDLYQIKRQLKNMRTLPYFGALACMLNILIICLQRD